jgi:hypothetical protein
MKKILILTFALLVSLSIFGRPKGNFRIVNNGDTLIKGDTIIEVNNYYDDDPFFYSNHLGMFYHGGFNPWYYDSDFGWNPYFGYNSYLGWGFGWSWAYPHYYHNMYHRPNYSTFNNRYNQRRPYGQNIPERKPYSPSYNRPKMSVRPNFNNTHIENKNRTTLSNRRVSSPQTHSSPSRSNYGQSRNFNSGGYSRNFSGSSSHGSFNNSHSHSSGRR